MKSRKTVESIYWKWFGLLALAYAVIPFFTPISEATKTRFPELVSNPLLLRFTQLAVLIPVVLIWIAAVYGISKFKSYAYSIRDSRDGKALDSVANGLSVLVYGGMVVSVATSLFSLLVTSNPSAARTITFSYVTLAYSLTAYALMLRGSWELVMQVNGKDGVRKSLMQAVIPFLLFVGLYVWLMFHNEYRNSTPDPARISSLYLPDPLIVLTIVIPYVTMWICGVLSAININVYQRLTKGAIYKQAMLRLSLGILMIIVFSILMQMLSTVGSAFAGLNLSGILGLIFIILLLYAICFLVVASGARKLTKIEEVQ